MALGINLGIASSECAGAGLLFDQYPSSSSAKAYSFRQIAAGVTNTCRLRRDGAGAGERDFTAAEITDGTLVSWVGSDSAWVVTFYDQGDNGEDVTQSVAGSQPQVAASGVLTTEGGRLAATFASDYLQTTPTSLAFSQINTLFCVANNTSATHASRMIVDGESATNRSVIRVNSSGKRNIWAGNGQDGDAQFADNVHELWTGIYNDGGNQSEIYINGASDGTGLNSGAMGSFGMTIGASYLVSSLWAGRIQEVIMYHDDQSANRALIEANINGYYSIF